MWSNGYQIENHSIEELKEEAISIESECITSYGELALELNMATIITLLERKNETVRNSMILFDRFGKRKLVYAKVHTCDFGDESNLTPGDDFYVTTLDTKIG